VDFGTVRVGLAVCDSDRKMASPLATYTRRNPDLDAAWFRDLAVREEIAALVIGLPVHNSGDEGQKAAEARRYGTWLTSVTGLPVVFYDERFTTVLAESALWEAGLTHKQRKARRDRVAAQMLLQAFLDAGCPDNAVPGPLKEP
jgi:putative Holliday junction resolvase